MNVLKGTNLSVGVPGLNKFATVLILLIATFAVAQVPTPDSNPDSMSEKADELLKLGKPQEAVALLEALAQTDPRRPALESKLGKAYFQEQKFAEAIPHLQAALHHQPDDRDSSQFLPLSLYSLGNFREALTLLEKLGPELPNDTADSPYLLSICYLMTQQPDKARKSLSQMFSVPEESAMAYLALAKLMVRQGMIEAATPQIDTALRLDSRLLMAHFLLGEIYLYQSAPQKAVSEFKKEMALNPTLWLVYWRLGDAYERVGNYDEAEKMLKEAVWLNDGSSAALALLGRIAVKKNDPALGAGFLERAVALDPQNADAHEMLANAYRALGREDNANRHTEISKKLRGERRNSDKNPLILK